MKYSYNLSEEIARWAFEVHIKSLNVWWIAFTNPTAGPWKRIESFNLNNEKGEIYRFDIDEKRPDIVVVNDELKIIIIFEAKDYLNKLNIESQVTKSALVIDDMAKVLKGIKDNNYWGNRSQYSIYNGLLWGSEIKSKLVDVNITFKNYSTALRKINSKINDSIQVGIESMKDENENIKLYFFSNSSTELAKHILKSLEV